MREALVGKVIMANYGKTSYYTIADVIYEELEQVQLTGTDLTIRDYYQQKYQITIKNLKQPLLSVENKNKKD